MKEDYIEANLKGLRDFLEPEIYDFYCRVVHGMMSHYAAEVAKETQRRCAENAKAESVGYSPAVYFCDCQYRVDKSSILDPKNLAI